MAAAGVPVRGTQSFVHTLSACWRRPGVTALEIAWRWLYGVPALALFGVELRKVLLAATSGTMDAASLGLDRVLLNDPVGALSADRWGRRASLQARRVRFCRGWSGWRCGWCRCWWWVGCWYQRWAGRWRCGA